MNNPAKQKPLTIIRGFQTTEGLVQQQFAARLADEKDSSSSLIRNTPPAGQKK